MAAAQDPGPARVSHSGPRADAAVAVRIRDMHDALRTSGLSQDVRMQLQRKLLKVCDAMKAPEADPVRAEGRLDQLEAELQREINRTAS